jgi:hypothetical protein
MQHKRLRSLVEENIADHKKTIEELEIALQIIPVDLLDTEVDHATGSGYYYSLGVTNTNAKTVGKLMGILHSCNKKTYPIHKRTEWKRAWNPEIQHFEGTIDDDGHWVIVSLVRSVGLGADCKRVKVRKTTEYETVLCGEPDEDVEILEVLE